MKINEENAKKLFNKQFGTKNAEDFAGRDIRYDDYGNDESDYGWNIDHILPVSKNGTDAETNLQCVNIITNQNKGEKTTWEDNEKTWQVKRVKGCPKKYEVVEVSYEQ